MLASLCAGTGPSIACIEGLLEVLDLMYADDVILLATSAMNLQRQLRVLELFCNLFSMRVNVAKTEVIVFRSTARSAVPLPPGGSWLLDDQPVRVVDRTVDLGCEFHAWLRLAPWSTRLGASAHKACMALIARCQERRITVPELQVRLYDAVVRPISTYGCPIWSPGHGKIDPSDMDHVFNGFDQTMFSFLR